MKNVSKKCFSLVELIVVVVILVVLAVISIMIVSKWIGKSRDSNRLATLKNVENSLTLYYAKKSTYPVPDDSVELYYSGLHVASQGFYGQAVTEQIDMFNKIPTDPLSRQYYEYSVLSGGKYFQVAGVLENSSSILLQSAYAVSTGDFISKILGNFNNTITIYTGGDYVFTYLPSLFSDKSIIGNGKIILNQQLGFYKDGFKKNQKFKFISEKITKLKSSNSTSGEKDIEKNNLVSKFSGLNLGLDDIQKVEEVIQKVPSVKGKIVSQPVLSHRCYYKYNSLTNADSSWTTNELYYNTGSNTCYIFGDENEDTKNACNKRITDNILTGGTFVWVPARWYVTDGTGIDMKNTFYQRSVTYNGNNYVCRGFALMKYEAKILGVVNGNIAYASINVPESRASGNSWAKLSQNNALSECLSLGTNYHLITNNEWMSMARNIEKQTANWSGGVMNMGHIVSTTNPLAATSDDSKARFGELSYNQNIWENKRTYNLSNGQILWDISGNVREHTNRSNLPTSSDTNKLLGNGNLCGLPLNGALEGTGTWETIGAPYSSCGSKYGPIQAPTGVNKNMGIVFTYGDIRSAMLRGGQRNDGEMSGIYAVSFRWSNTVKDGTTGFRCAK